MPTFCAVVGRKSVSRCNAFGDDTDLQRAVVVAVNHFAFRSGVGQAMSAKLAGITIERFLQKREGREETTRVVLSFTVFRWINVSFGRRTTWGCNEIALRLAVYNESTTIRIYTSLKRRKPDCPRIALFCVAIDTVSRLSRTRQSPTRGRTHLGIQTLDRQAQEKRLAGMRQNSAATAERCALVVWVLIFSIAKRWMRNAITAIGTSLKNERPKV
jgi:hypothetical protein